MWVPGQETTQPAISRPAVRAINPPAESTSGFTVPTQPKDKLIAALAYVTFIPAIVFVLIEPFKRNLFVRFHAFQSIFLAGATIVAAIAIRVLYSLFALIPVLGYLLAWLTSAVALLGWMILWLVLVVKALQGEIFKLPWIGNLADHASHT